LVLLFVGVAGFGTSIDLREACLDHRKVDVLPVQEDRREQPLVAINSVDFDRDALAFDQLLEIGLCLCAIGLAREFSAFRGLGGIYPKHSDAQLGLVGSDDGEGVAVGHARSGAQPSWTAMAVGRKRRLAAPGAPAARLALGEGAEVAIAGCSSEQLIQAQWKLGKVYIVVMDITDEGAVGQAFTDLSRVEPVLISAGTLRTTAPS
jgi:hypothetical protein